MHRVRLSAVYCHEGRATVARGLPMIATLCRFEDEGADGCVAPWPTMANVAQDSHIRFATVMCLVPQLALLIASLPLFSRSPCGGMTSTSIKDCVMFVSRGKICTSSFQLAYCDCCRSAVTYIRRHWSRVPATRCKVR